MKKVLILFIVACLVNNLYAQENQKSGQVIYERIQKVEINIQGELAYLSNILPKERKSIKELLFNQEASICKELPAENEQEVVSQSTGTATIRFKSSQQNDIVYHNIRDKNNVEQREFMTRQFLMTVDTDTVQWKITGKQKDIVGYNCLEAQLKNTNEKVFAWFTPMIPVSTGPDGYCGLPGLILAVDIKEGEITYIAQKVELMEVDSSEIEEPQKGKKVTLEEFEKIKEEKNKEKQIQSKGGIKYYKI